MKLLFENWRRYLDEGIMDKFYKKKQEADLDLQTIRDMYDAINRYYEIFYPDKRHLRYPRRSHAKTLKRKSSMKARSKEIIDLYENHIDPLLSQMLVVKNQMESGNYKWPKEMYNPPYDRIQKLGASWLTMHDPEKFIPYAIEKLQTARNNLLKLNKWLRGSSGSEKYSPPASMHDLQKVMDDAPDR